MTSYIEEYDRQRTVHILIIKSKNKCIYKYARLHEEDGICLSTKHLSRGVCYHWKIGVDKYVISLTLG